MMIKSYFPYSEGGGGGGGGVRMRDKMAISAYILTKGRKDSFSRLQTRAEEDFDQHQHFFHFKPP